MKQLCGHSNFHSVHEQVTRLVRTISANTKSAHAVYRNSCLVGMVYLNSCLVGIVYRNSCRVGVVYHTSCRVGIVYRKSCREGMVYRNSCRVGMVYRNSCRVGVLYRNSYSYQTSDTVGYIAFLRTFAYILHGYEINHCIKSSTYTVCNLKRKQNQNSPHPNKIKKKFPPLKKKNPPTKREHGLTKLIAYLAGTEVL